MRQKTKTPKRALEWNARCAEGTRVRYTWRGHSVEAHTVGSAYLREHEVVVRIRTWAMEVEAPLYTLEVLEMAPGELDPADIFRFSMFYPSRRALRSRPSAPNAGSLAKALGILTQLNNARQRGHRERVRFYERLLDEFDRQVGLKRTA